MQPPFFWNLFRANSFSEGEFGLEYADGIRINGVNSLSSLVSYIDRKVSVLKEEKLELPVAKVTICNPYTLPEMWEASILVKKIINTTTIPIHLLKGDDWCIEIEDRVVITSMVEDQKKILNNILLSLNKNIETEMNSMSSFYKRLFDFIRSE